ncbi:hypothetical protein E2C01_038342 [Portunus trituberculatus]|uniref:Uncharacterized protein n=1 Tax=Portunus trituberculatus TaxID=210409 RepID=A0A5B7FHR7_PORTR|nr:hypothetical protein [Portunus trituberculatus]
MSHRLSYSIYFILYPRHFSSYRLASPASPASPRGSYSTHLTRLSRSLRHLTSALISRLDKGRVRGDKRQAAPDRNQGLEGVPESTAGYWVLRNRRPGRRIRGIMKMPPGPLTTPQAEGSKEEEAGEVRGSDYQICRRLIFISELLLVYYLATSPLLEFCTRRTFRTVALSRTQGNADVAGKPWGSGRQGRGGRGGSGS